MAATLSPTVCREQSTYTYTAEGYRWINHENLAELLLALGADTIGIVGLQTAKCLLGVLLLGLIAWRAQAAGRRNDRDLRDALPRRLRPRSLVDAASAASVVCLGDVLAAAPRPCLRRLGREMASPLVPRLGLRRDEDRLDYRLDHLRHPLVDRAPHGPLGEQPRGLRHRRLPVCRRCSPAAVARRGRRMAASLGDYSRGSA